MVQEIKSCIKDRTYNWPNAGTIIFSFDNWDFHDDFQEIEKQRIALIRKRITENCEIGYHISFDNSLPRFKKRADKGKDTQVNAEMIATWFDNPSPRSSRIFHGVEGLRLRSPLGIARRNYSSTSWENYEESCGWHRDAGRRYKNAFKVSPVSVS